MGSPLTRLALAAALALAVGSCATGPAGTPPASPPPARVGLSPELRFFHDALVDHGDWVLIEPLGYVFRPRYNVIGWQPYQHGFWVPSDVYGWVWISSEPFGWATYHYGRWLYDRYQGWVWRPGNVWGPAWVAWQETDEWVGWAPLLASGSHDGVPGGGYRFVPKAQLAETDVAARAVGAAELGDRLARVRPVENTLVRGGVALVGGPSLEAIERVAGPLRRVRIDDLLADAPRDSLRPPAAGPASSDEARRLGEQSARDARALAEIGARPPSRLALVRPLGVPEADDAPAPAPRRARPPRGGSAPADTSGR